MKSGNIHDIYTTKQNSSCYPISPALYDQSIPQKTTTINILNKFLANNSLLGTEAILDVCCGTGFLCEYLGKLLPKSHVIGIDNTSNMLAFARANHHRHNVAFEQDDITLFNPLRKETADVVVCSWAVSHIPRKLQCNMTRNLYNYLKKNGKLLVMFPVMSSILSFVIQEIVNADHWKNFFTHAENSKVSYSAEGYNTFLTKIGFFNITVREHTESVMLKNKEELDCFVNTAVARYLPYLEEETLRRKFIKEISKNYLSKINSTTDHIPYHVTMLTAVAKRPALSCFLQADSPINQKIKKSKINAMKKNAILPQQLRAKL